MNTGKQSLLLIFLSVLLLITIAVTFSRMIQQVGSDKWGLPQELTSLSTFTDTPAFEVIDKTTFRFIHPEQEPYLRFSFPSGPYSEVQLLLRIRTNSRAINSVIPRGAMGTPTLLSPMEIKDQTATLRFAHVSEKATEYSGNRTFIGISFPHGILRTNDIVELVDFKFSYDLEN
jgi:hypothetical protein